MDTTQLKTTQLGTTGLEPQLSQHLALVERPDQVDAILAAASLALTDVDIAEIEGRNS